MRHASLPEVSLARYGETAWTLTGQHTGRTAILLTARGEHNALSSRQRLGRRAGCQEAAGRGRRGPAGRAGGGVRGGRGPLAGEGGSCGVGRGGTRGSREDPQ